MQNANLQFLHTRKKQVDSYLKSLIATNNTVYSDHSEANFLFSYLDSFVNKGKTIRGSLFLESLALFGKSEKEINRFIPIAAAMELIHSALLIQDDYMDQDETRRGKAALHTLIENQADTNKLRKPKLYAISSMICATDICFFIAFGEIVKAPTDKQTELISYLSQEYTNVGFAQWKDVQHGLQTDAIELADLDLVYLYKTARYTFVLPIILAAIICQIDENQRNYIEKAGENLGLVFQITDDYLNIFGDPQITGKPNGSDIAQDKETYYKYFILQEPKTDHQKIKKLFGKKDLTQKELTLIQNAITKFGIDIKIETLIENTQSAFEKNISEITNKKLSKQMDDLFNYLKNRKK